MTNLEKYNKAYSSTFNIDKNEFSVDFAFGLVKEWDSITHLVLITAIEDEFGIMFDSDDILNFLSYEEGKKIMTKYDVMI